MPLHIAKWGNSLAVRLPAALVRQVGWQAGDKIEAHFKGNGTLELAAPPAQAPTTVRAGLGLLKGKTREAVAATDPDAKLLRAVRRDDRQTRS